MQKRTGRLVVLLCLIGIALAPAVARAQDLPPPEYNLPVPLGPDENGEGIFVSAEFLFMRQTNPLGNQTIAFRGFTDVDGSTTGKPGTFVGSKAPALDVDQVSGPGTFEPGIAMYGGWRFQNGILVEAGWKHLADTRYSATATLAPAGFQVGPRLANSFLSSPVYNFPIDYSGPARDVNTGNPGGTFGIWNASDQQTIDFIQRFDQGTLNLRIPIDRTDNWRMYGIVGGRGIVMYERFRWRVVDADVTGVADQIDVAIYSNTVSNRLYGGNVGIGGDWFWGSSPLGAFACSAEIQGALMIDIVKERARFERGDRFFTAATRAINEYTFAPLVEADVSLWWYPYQGIQCRLGWDLMAIFNTVAAPEPVDFNYGSLTPAWEDGQLRFIRGFHVGVGFIF